MSLIIETVRRIRCTLCSHQWTQAAGQSIPTTCPSCRDGERVNYLHEELPQGPYGYGNSQPYS